MRNLAAGAAMLAAGLMPAVGSAGAEAQTISYIGVVGDLTSQCVADVGVGVGGGCFSLAGSSSGVVVSVGDAVNDPVGFRMDFVNDAGTRVGALLRGCGSIDATIPAGAARVRVGVDGPLGGPAACNTAAPEGIAVTGTISMLES